MKKILVVGETCKDEFVYCDTTRLCPEGPVPVLKPLFTTSNDGMSGNVVNNLKAIDPELCVEHIHQTQTVKKIRYVDKKSNHLFVRVDVGDDSVTVCDRDSLSALQLTGFDLVLVSDYNKGFLQDSDLVFFASLAPISILDTKKILTDDIVAAFSFIKLNKQEAHQNKHLSHREKLIITLGSEGAQYGDQIFCSDDPQETIDVSGAGDTFVASFAIQYMKTNNIISSIEFANQMSARVVKKRGVATP